MKLSEKIRMLRKKKGWSQEQLGFNLSKASSTGISRQAVSDWENGKTEPKLDNIRDLAEIFNVSFDYLLNEEVDLNDLNENSELDNSKTQEFMGYDFTIFKISKLMWSELGLFVVFLGAGLPIMFYLENLAIFGMILCVFSGVSFISLMIETILLFIRKGEYFGSIGMKAIELYFSEDGKNIVKRIPLKLIDNITVIKSFKKFRGTVQINLKDGKSYLINKLFKPYKLKEIFEENIK